MTLIFVTNDGNGNLYISLIFRHITPRSNCCVHLPLIWITISSNHNVHIPWFKSHTEIIILSTYLAIHHTSEVIKSTYPDIHHNPCRVGFLHFKRVMYWHVVIITLLDCFFITAVNIDIIHFAFLGYSLAELCSGRSKETFGNISFTITLRTNMITSLTITVHMSFTITVCTNLLITLYISFKITH